MIGRVLGNYRLTAKIGEGGMGAVYRAVDVMLEREVAIKAIRPDLAREPQIVERFRTEARLLARVQHPAIATIYSFFQSGEGGEELFLAMEFVPGRTLAAVIADEGPMPYERAVRLLGTALEGIQQAHDAGIIHRDLKPDNLMLTEGERLKVMDFGIARMAGASHLTRTGLLVGTLRYMAPEQIRGEEVDRRTDIYALGIVLYQLLTGRVPFDGTTDYSILRAQLEDPPPSPRSLAPSVPSEVERAVLRALAKEPAERFATVADFHRALRAPLAASEPTAARESPLPGLTSTLHLPRPAAGGSPATPPPPSAPPRTVQPPSEPTMATGRTRERERPATSPLQPAVPRPRPAAASTSYRPLDRRSWSPAALLVIAVLVVGGGGFALWQGLRTPAPAAGGTPATTDTATGSAATSEPATNPGAGASPSGLANPTQDGALTSSPRPAPPLGSAPRPLASPGVSASLSTTPPAPAPAPSETTPTVVAGTPYPIGSSPPATSEEPALAQNQPPSDLPPGQEIRQLASDLVESSGHLTEVYQAFLDQKGDQDVELTADDNALRDELDALNEAAVRFDRFFNAGLFARARNRFRRPNEMVVRNDLLRRTQEMQAKLTRVDQLLGAVKPSAEVHQAWSTVRAQWKRARALIQL